MLTKRFEFFEPGEFFKQFESGALPSFEALANVCDLVENVISPARRALGIPIFINSGFRTVEQNKAIGGAPNSQHLKGEAADLDTLEHAANRRLFGYIEKNLEFDQLIDENDFEWIHVSYKKGANRGQVLHLHS